MFKQVYSDLIPSSFVKKEIKRAGDTGHGEAKLYLTKDYTVNQYVEFFNSYSNNNFYFFIKDNLLQYMNNAKVKNYYMNRSPYHANYWKNYEACIRRMQPNLLFNLEKRWKLDSQGRFYIRSYDNSFRELFRSIALPDLTYLKIDRVDNINPPYIYYIFTLQVI